MKLFTKIALGTAGFFLSIAVICGLIAVSMGLTTDRFMAMVRNGDFAIQLGDDHMISLFGADDVYWHEGENHDIDDNLSDTVALDYQNLDIEFYAGDLEIFYGDVPEIQVDSNNTQGFKMTTEVKDGEQTIDIECNQIETKLCIILPKGMCFKRVEMELGASLAKIDGLQAEEMELSIGAGEADISNLNTKILDMEVGTGQVNVTNLTVGNLNLEVGLGEANVQVNGAESDFNYRVECGIGEVVVGNQSFGGLGAEKSIKNQDTSYLIDIECGIGTVDMQFLCDDEVSQNGIRDNCREEEHHH